MANKIYLGAVKGATGDTGATGLTGARGADGETPHIENDYWYIGTTNQQVKAKGSEWYQGVGAPTDQGTNGDYYLDTVTSDVYYKRNNLWEYLLNIKGATGERGAQGENATSLVVGTVTTLPHGEQAEATLTPIGGGAYRLDLAIPEGEQGIQGEQGEAGNTTAYVGGFAVPSLSFSTNPQEQIDSKLARNQGVQNAGKILTVDANGNITPTTSTAEDDVIDAYIVGETEYASTWLSLSMGGEPLTPARGKIYIIHTSGDYYLLQFVWNGSAYEQTGGGDTSELATKTEAVGSIVLSIDSSTFVITLQAKDVNGTNIGTAQTIDLPIESVLIDVDYDTTTKELILTLQNGNNVRVDISDIISGLQAEITANNKLSADLVDDTNTTNKFTNATEKATWNAKQDVLQYATMPTASASNEGDIIQYTGTTDSTYTSGHFYKCIENGGNYGWEEIEFSGSAPANMVTTDTTQTITGEKTFASRVEYAFIKNMSSWERIGYLNKATPYIHIYNNLESVPFGTIYTSLGMFFTPGMTMPREASTGIGVRFETSSWKIGFFSRTPSSTNASKIVVPYNKITMFDTGDEIISRLTNNEMLQDQVIVCIADSTDAGTTYEAKHTYKFNYANSTWTATDITPSATPVTTITAQSTNADIPSAKAVYDYVQDVIGDIDTALQSLNSGGGV